ncbi:glycosyl transferase group 1 [Dokdonia sp. MED134]|uniref:glycosyltransferase family 4 protein n=1 Tax=Dokdonia sp. MED134 TaxID=313590 RepID=UPI000068D0E6|nr:glycosyltransferase family 4 protein [Dokdonia sp. MED134]EAQ39694.1 glycosyl transferase group 1 [Dokdonia sp. MED134]
MPSRLTIVQTALPDYRGGFYAELYRLLNTNFSLYGGAHYFEPSVQTDNSILHKKLENKFLLGNRFLWQRGVRHLALEQGIVVLEMNPRILSNWWLLYKRKSKGLKTVLWGHAWPRKGKNSPTDRLRHKMRKLASTIVVYTKKQQEELQEKMPATHILAAPNALMSSEVMNVAAGKHDHLIYIGRLTPEKKPLFLVQAFKACLPDLPPETKLLIVGAGEEQSKIATFIKKHHLENRVVLYGHISDTKELERLYASSLFSVSPGYVGLSITQSFGFGVPMLISRDEPHSPEIEAAIEGDNVVFYETDDVVRFRESVKKIFSNREKWIEKRDAISTYCRERYTVEAMARVFYKLTQGNDR